MKKLLFLLTFTLFCASAMLTQAFAAPQNSRQGGGASTKRVATQKAGSNANRAGTRATTRKATTKAAQQKRAQAAAKSKTQERKEAQNQQFGLMPSELDNTNHNVFHADASAIKGARETEQALRYLPFVTIVNTAGFGSSFDLRGQGRLSANGVKLFINGVPATPVDSYYNPMPINTVLPQLIQEVTVTPGGGAVLYGSGAKGGVVNIITSQRSAPAFVVGGGYVNTMATEGHSFNAFAQAAENLGPHLKLNAGLAISVLGGPREGDESQNGEASLGAWYDIGWGQSVSVDADVFYNKTKTTPYNSLLDFTNINEFMLSELSLPLTSITGLTPARFPYEENRYLCLAGQASSCSYPVTDFEPSKDNRAEAGYGTIDSTLLRATAKVDYLSQLTQKLKFGATVFGDFQSTKYNEHKMNLPFFVLGYINPSNQSGMIDNAHYNKGYNWFLPRPAHPNNPAGTSPLFTGANGDNERADWHLLDQSGSKFDDYKFGGKARIDWQHDNGLFIFGLDFFYEMSNRDSKTYLRQAIVDGAAMAGIGGRNNNYGADASALKYGSDQFSALQANILDKTDINVLTTAAYIYDRYDFNRNFSVGVGMRYELKNYDVKITDNFEGKKLVFGNTNNQCGNENCDYVDYDNSNFNQAASNGRNQVINGVLQTTKRDGTANENGISTATASDEYNNNHDNFTFELAPVYRYSNTGSIYARGEFGYNAPPAWAMLRRIGIVWGASSPRDVWISMLNQGNQGVLQGGSTMGNVLEFDFAFEDTNLKNETYYTAELGWKEMIGSRRVPLGFTNLTINALLFSANVFYTASTDEFYFEGDTWSGMTFGNYEKSRRMGVELAAEQYLFGGALGINESFTYLKAQKFDCGTLNPLTSTCVTGNEWQAIPYTYDWKMTLGAAVNISTFLEVVDVDVSVWLQNSIYGNQNIYAQRMNVRQNPIQGTGNATATDTLAPVFYATREDKKLDPYLVSDFGVSVGINKNMGVVTVGVKNVFDTFYYDYYNNDRSAVVNENRYVVGRGRTVFVEGTFRY